MVRFELTSVMPVEADVAFDLSLSIDLHVDSFARSHEQAVGGIVEGQIQLGEFVTWRARHFGRTWTMTSVITEWDRPRRFVDEQDRGPYKSFHTRPVPPVGNGTQMMIELNSRRRRSHRSARQRVVLHRYLRHLIDVRNTFLIAEATKRGEATSADT